MTLVIYHPSGNFTDGFGRENHFIVFPKELVEEMMEQPYNNVRIYFNQLVRQHCQYSDMLVRHGRDRRPLVDLYDE